jgi:adenine-specific DNA-methyltransferase
VPHVTLKSIANAEIDVIWEHWQAKLDPLRRKLNTTLKKQWQEWEIPSNADKTWPETAKTLLPQWWEARISGRRRWTSPSRPKPCSRALADFIGT